MTPHVLYYYRVMPFGLKNASATYQRLMKNIFKPLIGQTMEVYINDIVVKSRTQSEHTLHLEETFRLMWSYNMRLNPTKCAFSVSVGKFLGFMVIQRGIEVDPDQIKIVLETLAPSRKKRVATPHRPSSCTKVFYNPFYRQIEAEISIERTSHGQLYS